ncbi:MAG: hypothetical protein RSD08_04335 [Oscillospiraceae bacterium]
MIYTSKSDTPSFINAFDDPKPEAEASDFDKSFMPRTREVPSSQASRPAKKLVRPWGYVGYFLLFSIPIVGLIFLIVFAFSDKNRNRRNFARGYFVYMLICAVVFSGIAYLAYTKFAVPLLNNMKPEISTAISSFVGSGGLASLSSEQFEALKSGDLSTLTTEQAASVNKMLALIGGKSISDDAEKPAPDFTPEFITELPKNLPQLLNGKSISCVQSESGVKFYAILSVSSDEFESFNKELAAKFELRGNSSIGSYEYYDKDTQSGIALTYKAEDSYLTIMLL